MAAFVKRRHGLFSRDHEHGLRTYMSVTPNGERDAWGMAATMDHSDIRGLGTALHLFLAGLPRSKNGDHPEGCSLKTVEDSPHRSHASRSRLGVWLGVEVLSAGAPLKVTGNRRDLGVDLHVTRQIPNKSGELAGRQRRRFCFAEAFDPSTDFSSAWTSAAAPSRRSHG